MVEYRDECCGCATDGYPCVGRYCSQKHVKYLICDECGEEVDVLYDGLCIDCFVKEMACEVEYIDD